MKTLFLILLITPAIFVSKEARKGISDYSTNENTSGTIVYEEMIKFNIELNDDNAAFADMMPKESKSEKLLYFNSEKSLYMTPEKEDTEDDVIQSESGDMQVMIEIQQPEEIFFCDLLYKKTVEQREFMTRQFLIEDDMKEFSWKILDEQGSIIGLPYQTALHITEEGDSVLAWFTPNIPVSTGPAGFNGLPGLILKISMDNGDFTITATSVSFDEFDEKVLKQPSKGKKVTRDEFKSIVEEKTKEMGGEGGENQIIIQIEN